MADENLKVEPFEREERYIVVKRKHLSPAKEEALRTYLHDDGINTVECAVVESDWPEYETVWSMVESRVTGRPTAAESGEREALARIADRLAKHFAGATGHLTENYGELSGQNFQMMTMSPDPEWLASDLERLPDIAAALQSTPPAMPTSEEVARSVKEALRGDYTDYGMEDAFFRWPVIERAILALFTGEKRNG